MIDIIKHKYEDSHIMKKFTKQLLEYRKNNILKQNRINNTRTKIR